MKLTLRPLGSGRRPITGTDLLPRGEGLGRSSKTIKQYILSNTLFFLFKSHNCAAKRFFKFENANLWT
jgi:hypothetical protein